MLTNWNFSDPVENETTGQINRQKSARNLTVVSLDEAGRSGVFFDKERKKNIATSLERCECSDFNFAGKNPKKTFRPCMHIYRLAMELGLLETKYTDYKHSAEYRKREAERRLVARQRVTIQLEAETERIKQLPRDPGAWGRWHRDLHESGLQLNRQYRAYAIVDEEFGEMYQVDPDWVVHGYLVNLERCMCPDFRSRRLPCKHVYAVAIVERAPIPLSVEEYRAARREGIDLLYWFA